MYLCNIIIIIYYIYILCPIYTSPRFLRISGSTKSHPSKFPLFYHHLDCRCRSGSSKSWQKTCLLSRCVFILVILGEIDLDLPHYTGWKHSEDVVSWWVYTLDFLLKNKQRAQRLSLPCFQRPLKKDHWLPQRVFGATRETARGFATKCRALTVLKTCSGVNRLAKQTTRGMVKTTSGCNAKLVKFDSLLPGGDGPILYQRNNVENPPFLVQSDFH